MTKRLLNAGSGQLPARRLAPLLATGRWEETRLDVDPAVQPEVTGSITEIGGLFPAESFDGIWCSHVMEHLFAHEVYPALLQFRAALKPDGFALILCPDLEAVAEHLLNHGLAGVAYESAAGPIRPLDMIYGHSGAIEAGRHYMAHRTGFTTERIGNLVLQAGFATARVRSDNFEICALAFMSEANSGAVQSELAECGFDFRQEAV